MGKKFYAVKKGFKTGIFENWDECKKQINGFSGAVYKSFKTFDEAQKFLGVGEGEEQKNSVDDAELIAYVDGSYNTNTKEFSYGMVIISDEGEKYFSEKYFDENLSEMRNVAGEIMGSMKAMNYCLELGKKTIVIYFDYEGIEKWCTGDWKTNKIGTQNYKKFYDEIKGKINVIFKKVKAHSGDKYNDMADKLAKKAVGII